jgi:hypothetical protein
VENDSDEVNRRVKQLLQKAETFAKSEHKRLEEFAETSKVEFSELGLPNDKRNAVSEVEAVSKVEQTIRSMIDEAKGRRITEAEAKVLMLYCASIKRANRDKLATLASAGEFGILHGEFWSGRS